MKELKIKRGLFIVLDKEKNKKMTFSTREAAEEYMRDPIIEKDPIFKGIEDDPFDFSHDEDLTF